MELPDGRGDFSGLPTAFGKVDCTGDDNLALKFRAVVKGLGLEHGVLRMTWLADLLRIGRIRRKELGLGLDADELRREAMTLGLRTGVEPKFLDLRCELYKIALLRRGRSPRPTITANLFEVTLLLRTGCRKASAGDSGDAAVVCEL